MTFTRPTVLASSECLEVTSVTVNQSCPVGFNTTRALTFTVRATTLRTNLSWRRAATSSDILIPALGPIASNGITTVNVQDIALDSTVTIEILEGSSVLMTFTLRHY